MSAPAMSAGRFLLGAVRDPVSGDLSSTRTAALALTAAGIVFAFQHPEQSATLGVLLGGGALKFFSRTRAESPESA